MKLALCNIENLATQEAMINTIRTHHNEIKLVILSNPYSAKKGRFLTQFWRNLTLRGMDFVNYLSVKMVAMPLLRMVMKALGLQPLPSITTLCKAYNIECIYVKNINDKSVIDKVKALKIELLTIFYFDQILQPELILTPPKGVINFHPAALPSCRGLFPILFSYLYNKQQYGLSAHWVTNTDIDAGPLIEQRLVECPSPASLLELDRAVCNHFMRLFPEVLAKVRADSETKMVHRTTNDSYFSYPSKTDLRIFKQSKLPFYRLTSLFNLLSDK